MNGMFTLPLTLEEQVCLLLYSEVRQHVHDTIQDHAEVQDSIHRLVYGYAQAKEEALKDSMVHVGGKS